VTDHDLVGEALGDFMGSGWVRHLPHCALFIFGAAATLQAEGRTGSLEQVKAYGRDGGLAAPAWFPLDLDAGGQADPDEVRHRQAHQAEVARTAAHVSLPPPQRQADVVELMCRLGLLHRDGDIEAVATRWQIARPLPLPEERIPLSDTDRADEDRMRWQSLHYRHAQQLIGRFVEQDLDEMTTSLTQLARLLDVDVDDAREAVLVLLGECGDFSADHDVERIQPHQAFALTVDWERFNQERISARIALPPPDDPR
jgi:hypothetical protein